MSFFGKLKDRLFRSSSKLDAGLDALVEGPAPEAEKPGLLARLTGRDEPRRTLDDAMVEELEDLLVQADLGRRSRRPRSRRRWPPRSPASWSRSRAPCR